MLRGWGGEVGYGGWGDWVCFGGVYLLGDGGYVHQVGGAGGVAGV